MREFISLGHNFRCIILFCLALFQTVTLAWAGDEVTCSNEISYRWRNQEDKELTVFYAKVYRSAPNEIEARAKLSEAMVQQRLKAKRECEQLHEDLAGCIAGKYAALGSLRSTLDFSARKELEQAVQADCNAVKGTCFEVQVSETVCVKQTPTMAEEDQTADKKKNEK